MNERIKELAIEAGYQPLPGFDFANSLEETYLKKFAQLIIRECCDMVNKHTQHNNPNDCLLVLDIKERFGVEL